MAEMMLGKLTRERFAAWLAGKPAGEAVGVRCSTARCPVARFLMAADGGGWGSAAALPDRLRVSNVTGLDLGHLMTRAVDDAATPAWAVQFMRGIDDERLETINDADLSAGESVTAGEALAALAAVS